MITGSDDGKESPTRKTGFSYLQGISGDSLSAVFHLIMDPEGIPHRHSPRCPPNDGEAADDLLRKPSADHDHTQHSPEEQIQ
jgi:hypothetical protein